MRALLGVMGRPVWLALSCIDSTGEPKGRVASCTKTSNRGVFMTKTKLLASAGFGMLIALAAPAQAGGAWTGVYLGGHAGGVWGNVDSTKTAEAGGGLAFDTSPVGTALGFAPDGVVGGAQVGYLYQFSSFVVGLEVSGSYADFDETRLDAVDVDNVRTVNSDWNAAATLRGGYAFDNSLAYVKGGFALARIDHSLVDTTAPSTGSYATSEDHEGWTAGVGFEQMLSGSFSLALEYDYYDFGGQDHKVTQGLGSVTREFDPELHTVTARLNWRFNP